MKMKRNMKVNMEVNVKVNMKESSFTPCYDTKLDRK